MANMSDADWVRMGLKPPEGPHDLSYDPDLQMFKQHTPPAEVIEKHQRFLRSYFEKRRPGAARRVELRKPEADRAA